MTARRRASRLERIGGNAWPRRLAVVGTGLLGASVGLAAKAGGVEVVVGCDASDRELEAAVRAGAIDLVAASVEEAAAGADLVVAATPVRAIPDVLRRARAADASAILTDVGSTKLHLLEELARSSTDLARIVPGHPMAGSDERGAEAARADLFEHAAWVLTPVEGVGQEALTRVTRFVRALGGRPLLLDAGLHDRVVAFASHLPQLAATALMSAVEEVEAPAALQRLIAAGFRDTTRLAASDPAMWVDICATNGPAIVTALSALEDRVAAVRTLVEREDGEGLRALLAAAGRARRRVPAKPGAADELHELVVHIADRPGSLAAVTSLLGEAGINVEDLAIDHELQGGSGVLRLWVAGWPAVERTVDVLAGNGWLAHLSGASGEDDPAPDGPAPPARRPDLAR